MSDYVKENFFNNFNKEIEKALDNLPFNSPCEVKKFPIACIENNVFPVEGTNMLYFLNQQYSNEKYNNVFFASSDLSHFDFVKYKSCILYSYKNKYSDFPFINLQKPNKYNTVYAFNSSSVFEKSKYFKIFPDTLNKLKELSDTFYIDMKTVFCVNNFNDFDTKKYFNGNSYSKEVSEKLLEFIKKNIDENKNFIHKKQLSNLFLFVANTYLNCSHTPMYNIEEINLEKESIGKINVAELVLALKECTKAFNLFERHDRYNFASEGSYKYFDHKSIYSSLLLVAEKNNKYADKNNVKYMNFDLYKSKFMQNNMNIKDKREDLSYGY